MMMMIMRVARVTTRDSTKGGENRKGTNRGRKTNIVVYITAFHSHNNRPGSPGRGMKVPQEGDHRG